MSEPTRGPTQLDAHATVRVEGVPRPGITLGRYDLVEVLGQGAMATVFRARDRQLARQVAVKVMNLAVAARSESAERFRREAQAVAAVKHPSIVEIFDFVAAAGPDPAYIVSELIDGPTLGSLLEQRRGRLLPEAAALVALPLAEALAVAHARGVVHRDIKPDNVMLDRVEGRARVVLTDFGVAHVTGLETMTATGALVGSPAYMSPEQARGHDVTPASDLWALGVLMYQTATGHLPFPGKDPLMVVAAICRGTFRRPSLVSQYVGPAFDDIIARCLAHEPAQRYATAAELAADLRGLLRGMGMPDEKTAGDKPAMTLKALLDEPDAFEAAVRTTAADAAVVVARKHARRGEFAKALSELSRATAYVPKHAEAERLFRSISSRRRWVKVGAVMAVVLAGVLGAREGWPRLRDWWAARQAAPVVAQPPAVQNEPVAITTTKEKYTETRPVETPPPVSEAHAPPPVPAAPPKRSPKRPYKGVQTVALPTAPVARSVPPVEAAPAPEPAPAAVEPAPTAKPAEAKRVTVEIFANNFFCSPSLDDDAPSISPAVSRPREGKHRIYCTMPGGTRHLVAILPIAEVLPGAAFRIQIKKGESGKPALDPDRTTKPRQPDPGTQGKAGAASPPAE